MDAKPLIIKPKGIGSTCFRLSKRHVLHMLQAVREAGSHSGIQSVREAGSQGVRE